MDTYHAWTVRIDRAHILYAWCDHVTALANNLSNAVRFRQRQLLTASHKSPDQWSDNEKEIVRELAAYGPDLGIRSESVPASITSRQMEALLRASANPDFFAKGLPRQSAQHVVSQTYADVDHYYAALADYQEHPEKYQAMPRYPGYKRKGGRATVYVSNQDCTLKAGPDGRLYARLPFAKDKPFCIGSPEGKLAEVKVSPDNGNFNLSFVFQQEASDAVPGEPDRICAIDMGVENLMAVTNNAGLPCLLFKGGGVKSTNRLYNKHLAVIMAEEMAKPDCPTKRDGSPRFVPTDASRALTARRNAVIQDWMSKTAKRLVDWCVENRIDTIVCGVNKGWKQNVSMGHVNNQTFVQIPFERLRWQISYRAGERGIRYVEQEESYTSKASFPDRDPIPVYGQNDAEPHFSGHRAPKQYRGMHSENGFRGLYKTMDGTILNSDLNGSANILRKAFPGAFEGHPKPDFNRVQVIETPDQEWTAANYQRQKAVPHTVSRSKARRLRRKAKHISG